MRKATLPEFTPELLFRELARIANADPQRLRRPDGSFLPIHEIPEDVRAAISSIEMHADGRIKSITLYSAKKARAILRRVKCFGNA